MREVVGRDALYLQGTAERFRDLMSWTGLNRLLAYGGLASPRLRLIQGEQEIPPSAYSHFDQRGFQRLHVAELTDLLRKGAVLAIDGIDQLDEHVAKLCRSLEKVVGVTVDAELYASWPDSAVRPPNWNTHETLLFEIDGQKEWSLFQPTDYFPTEASNPPVPAGPPRWRGTLVTGDLLYIPRGWWYQDNSGSHPALYLVVSFTNPRGADVVRRLWANIRDKDLLNMDIPRFGDADTQSRFITYLQQEAIAAITRPGMFRGLLNDLQEFSEPVVEFNLPWSANANPLPPSPDEQLVMLMRFPVREVLNRRHRAGQLAIMHNGRAIEFDEQITCIWERLLRPPAPTLNDLLEDCRYQLGRECVLRYVSELIAVGLLHVRPGECPDKSNQNTPARSQTITGVEK